MSNPSNKQISDNRRLLQDPYAHLDGAGQYAASPKAVEATPAQVSASRGVLQNPYAHVDGEGELSAWAPKAPRPLDQQRQPTRPRQRKGRNCSSIEQAARNLQVDIWQRRHEFWPDGVPSDPTQLLDPSVALRMLGFDYDASQPLGQFSHGQAYFEVAGLIDRSAMRVHISPQQPLPIRRFTAAHELGHAVLHDGLQMHRDRPMDGSEQERGSRDKFEKEADKFATFFLMPEKLVVERFRQAFLCDRFVFNDETAIALNMPGVHSPESGCKSLRELARILANARYFNGRHFPSLADRFGVSVEAMAIRLEELKLLDL